MRKNRRRWIPWLALVLGLLVWWGLGWYLAPRPLYTLRFPTPQSWIQDKRYNFLVKPIDVFGRYFLILSEPPIIDGDSSQPPSTLQIYEFPTGRLVLSRSIFESGFNIGYSDWVDHKGVRFQDEKHRRFDQNGIYYSFYTSVQGKDREKLIAWNLLTDEHTFLRAWPNDYQPYLSPDGSLLAERTNFPLFIQIPAPLPSAPLWTQAAVSFIFHEDTRMRAALINVLSLPDLTMKYQVAISPPRNYDDDDPIISFDGRWLAIHRCTVVEEKEKGDEKTEEQRYICSPNEIQIYDLKTGRAREIVLPRDSSIRFATMRHDILEVSAMFRADNHYHDRYLHLPSGKWLEIGDAILCDAEKPSENPLHPCRLLSWGSDGYTIWEMNADGFIHSAAHISEPRTRIDPNESFLIPGCTQIADLRLTKKLIPQWLEDLSAKLGVLQDWLDKEEREFVVKNYKNGRTLLRMSAADLDDGFHVTQVGNYLIFKQLMADHHAVSVFALPLRDYSPWWSRCAGLLTLIVACFVLRRLARS